MNTITMDDITKAYDLMKEIIDHKLVANNIKYISSELAPNDYKGMRQYRDDFGQYLVFNGGDHGFLGQDFNIKFRALHDHMHYTNNLSFKFEDEKELSRLTQWEFMQYAYNKLNVTQWDTWVLGQVIKAEIQGQIEYYEKNREYVTCQKTHVLEYLNVT